MTSCAFSLRSYSLMVIWELRSLRLVLPVAIVVQIMTSSGLVLGFGFLLGEIPSTQALFLAAGVTVISMITLGMVLAPQMIAAQKQSGTYEYMMSLPVPRAIYIAAGLTVNSFIAIPGAAAALAMAWWRYDTLLTLRPVLAPAALLILITSTSIGFALAHAIPNPMVTSLVTNILIFVILFYAPINFPPNRLPEWLATFHSYLPFVHMAYLIRAGLAEGLTASVGTSFAILGAWAAVSWGVTSWVVGIRG